MAGRLRKYANKLDIALFTLDHALLDNVSLALHWMDPSGMSHRHMATCSPSLLPTCTWICQDRNPHIYFSVFPVSKKSDLSTSWMTS